jgi:uncharacterized protein (DUF983 family)
LESWYVTAVLNQCPNCQQGALFKGWIKLHETCEVCGARFERWPGSWTGPTVGGYGVGAAVGAGMTLVMARTGTLFDGAQWLIGLVAVLAILLVYRPIKAAWIGMMYDWGYVYPDPPKNPPAPGGELSTAAASSSLPRPPAEEP